MAFYIFMYQHVHIHEQSFSICSFDYFIALFHCLDIPFTINVYLNLYNKIRIYICMSSKLRKDSEPPATSDCVQFLHLIVVRKHFNISFY